MKLAVCVPCYRTHVPYLAELIDSIERQTCKPDIISISISGTTEEAPELHSSIPIRIRVTKDEGSPAENRNWAAEQVLDEVDILSFIDADDIMHSRRTEAIKYHMAASVAGALYHSYTKWETGAPIHEHQITGNLQPGRWVMNKVRDPNLTAGVHWVVGVIRPKEHPIHRAHVSVRTNVFRRFQFPLGRHRSDDSEYLYILHTNRVNAIVLRDSLTFFRAGATTLTSGVSSSQS